jgi:hypothetical protein
MNMYNYFLKARVSLRTLSSLVINLFTQLAIVLELALLSSHVIGYTTTHSEGDSGGLLADVASCWWRARAAVVEMACMLDIGDLRKCGSMKKFRLQP